MVALGIPLVLTKVILALGVDRNSVSVGGHHLGAGQGMLPEKAAGTVFNSIKSVIKPNKPHQFKDSMDSKSVESLRNS